MSCINLGWGKASVQGKVKNIDWVSLVYLSRFEEACRVLDYNFDILQLDNRAFLNGN